MKASRIALSTLIVAAALLWMGSASAASGQFSGEWILTFDRTLDGTLNPLPGDSNSIAFNSHHNRFIGEYLYINNDGFYQGETLFDPARSTRILRMLYVDLTYYAVHIGKEVSATRFEGTWFDNEGQSGDFSLEKL